MIECTSRRRFLKTATAVAGIQFLPGGIVGLRAGEGAANRVNLAFVGVGGRGEAHWTSFAGQNFVAFCDVDSSMAAGAMRANPGVPLYFRYRDLLAQRAEEIDAVVVSTADHSHFAIAKAAMELGKHVYVEKPLAQSVAQVRELKRLAVEKGVVTQMGNQGHSTPAIRQCREMVQAGMLGAVRRVQCWTDRPVNWWPQGRAKYPGEERTPRFVDWEAWLDGIDAERFPYAEAVHPFAWRGFQAFGTGALGDMACHVMDAAVWSLDLGPPTSVTAEVEGGGGGLTYPQSSRVTYRFPARGEMPELELVWTDGNAFRPERPAQLEEKRMMGNPDGGSLIEGELATMMGDSHSSNIEVIPEPLQKEFQERLPERSIPRVRSHWHDFINAIREGRQPSSSIQDYSANLTEIVLLGALAQRFPGEVLEYDAENLRFAGHEAATAVLTDPRAGVVGSLVHDKGNWKVAS